MGMRVWGGRRGAGRHRAPSAGGYPHPHDDGPGAWKGRGQQEGWEREQKGEGAR